MRDGAATDRGWSPCTSNVWWVLEYAHKGGGEGALCQQWGRLSPTHRCKTVTMSGMHDRESVAGKGALSMPTNLGKNGAKLGRTQVPKRRGTNQGQAGVPVRAVCELGAKTGDQLCRASRRTDGRQEDDNMGMGKGGAGRRRVGVGVIEGGRWRMEWW